MSLDKSQKEEILEAIEQDQEFKQKIRDKIFSNTENQSAQNQESDRKLTRRGFLKTLGLGAGGLALSGLGASTVRITDQGIRKDGEPLVPFSLGSSKLNDNLNLNGNKIVDSQNGNGIQLSYNASEQNLVIADENANNKLSVDKNSGDIKTEGELTENASL